MPIDKDKLQSALNDYIATWNSGKRYSDKEVFEKFPEFENNPEILKSANDYVASWNSGKYDDVEEMNSKFPEFFGSDLKKKGSTVKSTDSLFGEDETVTPSTSDISQSKSASSLSPSGRTLKISGGYEVPIEVAQAQIDKKQKDVDNALNITPVQSEQDLIPIIEPPKEVRKKQIDDLNKVDAAAMQTTYEKSPSYNEADLQLASKITDDKIGSDKEYKYVIDEMIAEKANPYLLSKIQSDDLPEDDRFKLYDYAIAYKSDKLKIDEGILNARGADEAYKKVNGIGLGTDEQITPEDQQLAMQYEAFLADQNKLMNAQKKLWNDYSEQIKERKLKEAKQKVADLYYQFNPSAEFGAITANKLVGTIADIVSLTRSGQQEMTYTPMSKLFDKTNQFLTETIKMPEVQKQLVNDDGSVNYDRLPQLVYSTLLDMGIMLVGAGKITGSLKAAGVAAGLAEKTGLMTSSFIQQFNDYEQAAKEADPTISAGDAAMYAWAQAGISAILETPTTSFDKKLIEKTLRAAKGVKFEADKTIGAIMSEKLKDTGGELIQEYSQQAAETGVNYLMNKINGVDTYEDELKINALKETGLLTIPTTLLGGSAGDIMNKMTPKRASMLNGVIRSPEMNKALTNIMSNEKLLTPEQKSKFQADIQVVTDVNSKIPESTPEDVRSKTFPLLFEKTQLENENKTVDPVFQKANEKKIAAIDGELNNIVNKQSVESTTPTYAVDGETMVESDVLAKADEVAALPMEQRTAKFDIQNNPELADKVAGIIGKPVEEVVSLTNEGNKTETVESTEVEPTENIIKPEATPEVAAQVEPTKSETDGMQRRQEGRDKEIIQPEQPASQIEGQAVTQQASIEEGGKTEGGKSTNAATIFVQKMDEYRQGFTEGKKFQKQTDKEKAENLEEAKKFLVKHIKENFGNISKAHATQVTSLISEVNKVKTDVGFDKVMDKIGRVVKDGEYLNKLAEANKASSTIKGMGKNPKTPTNVSEAYKEFAKIQPSKVEDIDAYNEIAQRIVSDKAKLKEGYNVSVKEIEAYTEKANNQIEADDAKKLEERIYNTEQKLLQAQAENRLNIIPDIETELEISKYEQQLRRFNKEPLTEEELQKKIDELNAKRKNIEDFTKQKQQEFKDKINPDDFTDANEKEVVSTIPKIDVEKLTDKDLFILNSIIDNITTNNSFMGAGEVVAIDQAEKAPQRLVDVNKKYKGKISDVMTNPLSRVQTVFKNISTLIDSMTNNQKKAAEWQVVMRLHGIMVGIARTNDYVKNVSTKVDELITKYDSDRKEVEKNGSILSAENQAIQSVYASLIQQDSTPEEMAAEIQAGINHLKTEIEAAKSPKETGKYKGASQEETIKKWEAQVKLTQDALNLITRNGYGIDAMTNEVNTKSNKNNTELVNEMIAIHDSYVSDLEKITNMYGGESFTKVGMYTPRSWDSTSSIIETKSRKEQKAASEQQIIDNFNSPFFAKNISKKNSGNTINRTGRNSNQYLNLNFIENNLEGVASNIFAIETLKDRTIAAKILNNNDIQKPIGGEGNQKLIRTYYAKAVNEQQNINSPTDAILTSFVDRTLKGDWFKKVAVRVTLAGGKQYVLQPLVLANTFSRLGIEGDIDLIKDSWLMGQRNRERFKDGTIIGRGSNVGDFALRQANEKMLEVLERTGNINKALKAYENFVSKLDDKMLRTIVDPDVMAARVAWTAAYTQKMREITGNKKLTVAEAFEIKDESAASYADQMVNTYMGANTQAEAPIIQKRRDELKLVRDGLMSFGSFVLGQRMRMTNSVKKLYKGNAREGASDLVTSLVETAVYEPIKKAWAIGLYYGTAALLNSVGAWSDDDKEEYLKSKDLSFKGVPSEILGSYLFAGTTTPGEKILRGASNWLYSKIKNNPNVTGDELFKVWNSKDQGIWADLKEVLPLHTIPVDIAVGAVDNAIDALSKTSTYTKEYDIIIDGVKVHIEAPMVREISDPEQAITATSFALKIVGLFLGMSESSINKSINDAVKNIENKTKSEGKVDKSNVNFTVNLNMINRQLEEKGKEEITADELQEKIENK